MKLSKKLVVLSLLAFVATGCSLFGKKDLTENMNPAKAQNGVYDPSTASNEPVDLKDGNMTSKKVFDAGSYSAHADVTDVVARGGKNGDVVPTEKFYAQDREKNAPTGKLLYVLTEENPGRCIKAKFLTVNNKKQLVVFSKDTVPSTYCIYQKTFNPEPEGFTVSLKNGGICQPSYAVVTVDDQKRKISSVDKINNIVSIDYCLKGTVSYGETLSSRKGN